MSQDNYDERKDRETQERLFALIGQWRRIAGEQPVGLIEQLLIEEANELARAESAEQVIGEACDVIFVALQAFQSAEMCKMAETTIATDAALLVTRASVSDIAKAIYEARLSEAVANNAACLAWLMLQYITEGKAFEACARLCAANFAKAPDGVLIKNEAGKIMKPQGWQPAQFGDLIARDLPHFGRKVELN